MLIVSFNTRGLGGPQKKTSLKRLCNNLKPSVIMLQETMLEFLKAESIIKELLKDWEVESLDSDGLSGGLIMDWSPAMLKIDSKKLESTLETKIFDKQTGLNFTLLNVYSHFYERNTFSEKIKAEGVFNQPNVILGGDMNLTLTAGEGWGEKERQDSLALYFKIIFEKEHLGDVKPLKLETTWRNKRGGPQAI